MDRLHHLVLDHTVLLTPILEASEVLGLMDSATSTAVRLVVVILGSEWEDRTGLLELGVARMVGSGLECTEVELAVLLIQELDWEDRMGLLESGVARLVGSGQESDWADRTEAESGMALMVGSDLGLVSVRLMYLPLLPRYLVQVIPSVHHLKGPMAIATLILHRFLKFLCTATASVATVIKHRAPSR